MAGNGEGRMDRIEMAIESMELRTSEALTDERFRALIDTLRNPPKN